MQPRLAVGVLVLRAEGLVCAIRYPGFLFQTAPTSVVDKANQIAILIGHFSWNADLIAVEVVGLLAVFASERVAFYGNAAVVVASVNGGQIAVAVVVVAIWQRSSEKCLHCAYLTLGMEILYKIRISNF